MKFKVEIKKLGGSKFNGFVFSIIHPKTNEPFYEYFDNSEYFGKKKAVDFIKNVNEFLTLKEKESENEACEITKSN